MRDPTKEPALIVAFGTSAAAWYDISFRPVFRGRPVAGHPPLDPATIKTFGLIIAGRQEGPFCLELESIAGYRESQA